MHIVIFAHSLLSDWNHGNAHFLRGVATELLARGHKLQVFEPRASWSLKNLLLERGEEPLREWEAVYPTLPNIVSRYDDSLDLDVVLEGADLVLVHEWNDHDLVRRIGLHRAHHDYKLLFHDTHHRAVSQRQSMANYDLRHYDGVLAFGNVIRDLYRSENWARQAWTWHEAADTRVFHPSSPDMSTHVGQDYEGDLVWIGNWGDDERTQELHEFLLRPVRELNLKACVYGVRYPASAREALAKAGIEYRGWLPNYQAPPVFSRFKATVHVPRRPYVEALPGIPTIRVFEALACGIPLVSAPWNDAENLFSPGEDYLVARDGHEMKSHLHSLMNDANRRQTLSQHGLQTIRARHTCARRVDELLDIYNELP